MEENFKNIIAPSELEITSNYLKLSKKFSKTTFFMTYPRYLATGWFSPIINAPELMDISIFIHPIDTALALKNLKRKAAQIEAQIMEREQKGLVRSPLLETARNDIEMLRDSLQQSTENLFNAGVYITFYAESLEELNKLESRITNLLESRLVYNKPAVFQQLEGLNSTLPILQDELKITTPFNSSPIASFFPFVSANLTSDRGILHGVNMSNNTLVIFDRFALENANKVIFATSGSGKSYAAKLEVAREMMFGTDIIVIDPENEYKNLAEAVGGTYINVSLASKQHINPFDVPIVPEGESPEDTLRSHIVNLTGLLKLMLGKITASEEALLDRAVSETYAAYDIVPGKDFSNAEAPLLSDFVSVLDSLSGGQKLAQRLYRFTEGSYAGFTNQPTNIDIHNRMVVFSIRNLEDELRPVAMYIILNFIWNVIKSRLKKRIVIVDEAWLMMRFPDGASFMFGLVKRARKYYLGVTTITQDVEDFMLSPYGRPIITNSSLQLLLKQQPAMLDTVAKTFNLTEAEKRFLLDAQVGEGLFFAGLKHVAIKVVASPAEDLIITTNPEELLK